MSLDRRIIVIAGPNGAGKSTFAREFLPNEAACPVFVNADLIAAGLSPFAPEKAAIRAGRLMLEELGYQVLATSSAEEALELGQADDGREIDLLLTDVVMPEMGGKELAEVLQVANPNLKVLFMSGYALQASVSEEADEEKFLRICSGSAN